MSTFPASSECLKNILDGIINRFYPRNIDSYNTNNIIYRLLYLRKTLSKTWPNFLTFSVPFLHPLLLSYLDICLIVYTGGKYILTTISPGLKWKITVFATIFIDVPLLLVVVCYLDKWIIQHKKDWPIQPSSSVLI